MKQSTLFLLWLTLTSAPGAAFASSSGSDPSLLAYWSFDEPSGSIAYDLVGQSHIQIRGAVRDGTGRLGSALSFSEDGTYAQADQPRGIHFDAAEPFSISAWVRLSEDRSQFPFGMEILHRVDRQNGNKGVSLSVLVDRASGAVPRVVFQIGEREGSSLMRILTGEALSLGRWHLVVATYDGSGKANGMRIYIDDKLATVEVQHDSLSGPITTDVPLQIGSSYVPLWQMHFQFKGRIDEVSVWRGALTDRHVRLLQQTAGRHVLSEPQGFDAIGLLVLLSGAAAVFVLLGRRRVSS